MTKEIIDFHTHPYLTEPENACMYKGSLCLAPGEAEADLKRAGIGHICGSVIEPQGYCLKDGFAGIRRLNEQALKVKELYGDFYTPGFHIHPAFVEESLETLEWMHEKGFRLIGELVPYMHGWKEAGMDYASENLREILKKAAEYQMIVNFHTMSEWQEQMEAMIAQNPQVTFVAAHPGDRDDFLKHLERLNKYDNIYLDLSGTGLFRYGMLRHGIETVGAEKFLFGTDYPIVNPGMYVEAVRFEHISEKDREMIFSENAKRLLFN